MTRFHHSRTLSAKRSGSSFMLLLGAYLQHQLALGPPGRGWAERVVDTLWPALADLAR